MAKKKAEKKAGEDEIEGVEPDVVAHVVETAKDEGLPPAVAKEILEDGVESGVAPDKLEEVADEAVRVESEDRTADR